MMNVYAESPKGGGRATGGNVQQTAPAPTRGGVRATLGRAATGARSALNRVIRPMGRNR